MKFTVRFVPGADGDLGYYQTAEQKVILDAIGKFLEADASTESKRRKQLRPNPLAPWELRIGNYRVFYEIKPEALVRVLAIGHKVHNDLFIRGERVEV
ncbi:MAG TPA: type II toxin-antitoxin system RelE/ParE family toxin [Candidatus Methylomirabilis sp.]|nr:type II toxin-antitoxin system RelE/ParE family toxin [Candidatus Methylomirabilis sp.]